jgi:hypothetical protein
MTLDKKLALWPASVEESASSFFDQCYDRNSRRSYAEPENHGGRCPKKLLSTETKRRATRPRVNKDQHSGGTDAAYTK